MEFSLYEKEREEREENVRIFQYIVIPLDQTDND